MNSIISAANAEWDSWGNSTWNHVTGLKDIKHTDDETPFAQYVIDTYNAAAGGSPWLSDISNDDYAWSAVGMSTIMKNAGYLKTEFPRVESHSVLIRRCVEARRDNNAASAYRGFRLTEAGGVPAIGDLVGDARHATQQLTVRRRRRSSTRQAPISATPTSWLPCVPARSTSSAATSSIR